MLSCLLLAQNPRQHVWPMKKGVIFLDEPREVHCCGFEFWLQRRASWITALSADEGIALFCVVGKDCEVWEEAMDYLCVNLDVSADKPGAFCVTTSHPVETVDEVVKFASNWNSDKGNECDVEVKEI